MKIVDNDLLTPEYLTSLDKKKNIIIVTPSEFDTVSEICSQTDIFKVHTDYQINLANNIEIISPNLLSTTIYPKFKISLPAGIKINFISPNSYLNPMDAGNVFQNTYITFNALHNYEGDDEKITNVVFTDFKFTLYVDVIELRKHTTQLVLPKGFTISQMFFSWYIQTAVSIPMVENIILIKHSTIYETFSGIF